jgi:hypothetical protein
VGKTTKAGIDSYIRFLLKRQHTITKMNDNINMDSTIATSVIAHS